MSIARIFSISKRSLLAHQSAIDTAARNIANVNTEGYKRRRVDLSRLAFGFSGLSGRLTQENVTRLHQRFVENQLWYENQNMRKYQTDEMVLTQIEDMFGEPLESGLSSVLSEFWNAWNGLANDPESQSARGVVRDKGVLLANTFNRVHHDLKNLQNQIRIDIQGKVTLVNQMISQIRTINEQVSFHSSYELLDQRDLLIGELSNLINIDVREHSNGGITVSSGGQILVSGDYEAELSVEISTENGLPRVDVELGDGNRLADFSSGELGSLIKFHNQYIPDYVDKLNTLAANIVQQVNSVHASGYNIDGITGISFFADDVSGADDFEVSDEILGDPSLIATSASPDETGDGSAAQAISDLQFAQFLQDSTPSDFYNSLISEIGSQVQEAAFLRESEEMVVQSLQNQRDSISGVSLDEEMTKLMAYEQGYEAAARLVTTVDEMIETVLNMV